MAKQKTRSEVIRKISVINFQLEMLNAFFSGTFSFSENVMCVIFLSNEFCNCCLSPEAENLKLTKLFGNLDNQLN